MLACHVALVLNGGDGIKGVFYAVDLDRETAWLAAPGHVGTVHHTAREHRDALRNGYARVDSPNSVALPWPEVTP